MSPGHAARQDLAADRCEQFPDLRTRAIACTPAARQGLAGLEYERLNFLGAHAQHLSYLGVRVIAQLKENQRGTLVVGQPLQVVEQFADVLLPLHLVRWGIEARSIGQLSGGVERLAPGTQLG
jgi:hypothetical protein